MRGISKANHVKKNLKISYNNTQENTSSTDFKQSIAKFFTSLTDIVKSFFVKSSKQISIEELLQNRKTECFSEKFIQNLVAMQNNVSTHQKSEATNHKPDANLPRKNKPKNMSYIGPNLY